jgi:magnesium-transporting ATPase (P-type)
MTQAPRRVGKRLIGRYLLFRMAFATVVLICSTIGAVFWVRSWGTDADYTASTLPVAYDNVTQQDCSNWYAPGNFCCPSPVETSTSGNSVCPNTDGRNLVRAQASNTLTLCAIAVMLSARFAYNTAFSARIFTGNVYAWYSAAIVLSLQLSITYIPGLNNIVFGMGPMIAAQWGLCALFFALTLLSLEAEKMLVQFLKRRKHDVDDDQEQLFVANDDEVIASSRGSAAMQQLLHK